MEFFRTRNCGHVEETSSLLKNKLSFMNKDKNGFTPLFLAASTLDPGYRKVYNAKKKLYGEKLSEGEQMSTLHFACCANDHEIVERLLTRGADINERIPQSCPFWPGYTPLQLCIKFKFEDLARALLGRGADVSIVSPDGRTPIFMAENNRLCNLTATMLSMYKSWTVNTIDEEDGVSYLHLACQYGLVNVVEAFLHHGADANLQINATSTLAASRRKTTPLHVAKDASVVKALLRYGASLVMKDHFGNTPLHIAFHHKKYGALEAMFGGHGRCRANPVNKRGISHFHIACLQGSETDVKGFLQRGVANINAATLRGRYKWSSYTPLHFAVERGSPEVVQLLLDRGASPEDINGNGWAPLHMAASLRDDTSIAQMLLDAGSEVDVNEFNFGATPLHVAAEFDRPNHVALFLDRGADLTMLGTKYWWSPLHVACQKLHVEIVRLLLERGADPNEKQDEQEATPLHVCVRAHGKANSNDDRHGRIIRLLVEAGADLEARDFRNCSPVHDATDNKDDRPLRALLFYGPDIHARGELYNSLAILIHRISSVALLEHLEVLRYTSANDVTSHDNDPLKIILKSGICSEDEATSIRNACRKELEVLREMGLDICLTYFNVLTKNAVEVNRLLHRSEKLAELVESNELHRFPVYEDRLRMWYEDMQRVESCLNQAQSCLNQALVLARNHWNLDQDSSETIFRYLNFKELETMVKAFNLFGLDTRNDCNSEKYSLSFACCPLGINVLEPSPYVDIALDQQGYVSQGVRFLQERQTEGLTEDSEELVGEAKTASRNSGGQRKRKEPALRTSVLPDK